MATDNTQITGSQMNYIRSLNQWFGRETDQLEISSADASQMIKDLKVEKRDHLPADEAGIEAYAMAAHYAAKPGDRKLSRAETADQVREANYTGSQLHELTQGMLRESDQRMKAGELEAKVATEKQQKRLEASARLAPEYFEMLQLDTRISDGLTLISRPEASRRINELQNAGLDGRELSRLERIERSRATREREAEQQVEQDEHETADLAFS